jgi:hypothetical protein
MRSNLLLLVLFWTVWLVPLGIIVIEGPSARPLVFLLLALSVYLFACSRPEAQGLWPRWPGRHHKH